MLNVTQEYIAAAQSSSRTFNARLELNGVEYTTDKLVKMRYDSAISSGNALTVGGGYINALSVEICEVVTGLQELMSAKAYIGLLVGSEFIEQPLGEFFISEIKLDRNANRTTLKLQDGMVHLTKPYETALKYPQRARAVVTEVIQKLGLQAGAIDVTDVLLQAPPPEKATFREVLVWIAQISGAFVRFDRFGRLDFLKLSLSNRRITRDNYYLKGLTRNEIAYKVGGITATGETTKNGKKEKFNLSVGNATHGNQVEVKNPWMEPSYLQTLWAQLKPLNYFPYTLKWQGDPAIEAGDWVGVEADDGTVFNVPVLVNKLSFGGGVSSTISAQTATHSQTPYKYKGTLQQHVEYLDTLVTSQGRMYLDVEAPTEPKNGDIWFKPNGGYVELWEFKDNAWVKKADTADLNAITTSLTTDEVIAKKLAVALANVIELNAKKIVAGDLDLARVRIMDGAREVLTVRDGRLVVNLGDNIVTQPKLEEVKKRLQDFVVQVEGFYQVYATKEQLASLLGKYGDDIKEYERLLKQAQVESRSYTDRRSNAIEVKLGEHQALWQAMSSYMTFNADGMTLGRYGDNIQLSLQNNKMSFLDGGREVAYVSNQTLYITSGVFVSSLVVGNHKLEKLGQTQTVISYVGGVN